MCSLSLARCAMANTPHYCLVAPNQSADFPFPPASSAGRLATQVFFLLERVNGPPPTGDFLQGDPWVHSLGSFPHSLPIAPARILTAADVGVKASLLVACLPCQVAPLFLSFLGVPLYTQPTKKGCPFFSPLEIRGLHLTEACLGKKRRTLRGLISWHAQQKPGRGLGSRKATEKFPQKGSMVPSHPVLSGSPSNWCNLSHQIIFGLGDSVPLK